MIKNILISLLLGVSLNSFAASQPAAAESESTDGQMVPFDQYPRVLNFQSGANALTVNGEILVCFVPFITNWGKCADSMGNNKWQSIHNVQIPGFKAHAYKYVNVGSGGYRNLYVFFKKVN